MSVGAGAVEFVRAVRSWSQKRDEARGYSVNLKRLGLAFSIELTVIATSLYGAWLFTQMYGHGDRTAMHMMMLAPIAYALIELSRVPLAVAARTHRSWMIRSLAVVGVVAAAGVTIKSMSQLGEIMFRPRLIDVVKKQEALLEARNEQASLAQQIADADAVVEQRANELKATAGHLTTANAQLGGLPPQRCSRVTRRDRDGQPFQTQQCTTDPRTSVMAKNLQDAQASRDAASSRLDAARAERSKLDRVEADGKLSDAEVAYKDAVFASQLHAFTSMAFAKDPTHVTDGEIAEFLRIFVFLPALFVSLASTLLAITSIERIEPEPKPVTVDDGAGAYILEPFAVEVIREATQAARQEAEQVIRKAAPPKFTVVEGAVAHAS